MTNEKKNKKKRENETYRATELKTKIEIYCMLNLDSLIKFYKRNEFFFLCKKICLFPKSEL